MTAVQSGRYHVTGEGAPAFTEHSLRGEMADNWQFTDLDGAPAWGKCGKSPKFDIDTQLRVDAPASAPFSYVTVDSTDGGVSSVYRLAWRSG